jgi:hypothetical protein
MSAITNHAAGAPWRAEQMRDILVAFDVLNVVSGTGERRGEQGTHYGFALRPRVEARIFSSLVFEPIKGLRSSTSEGKP